MEIRLSRTGTPFHELEPTTTPLMREIGAGLLTRIRQRTKAGIAADGVPFPPLSAAYALQKFKALGNTRPDLTVSGRMLNDIGVFPSPAQVTLAFTSSGGKASGKGLIQRSRAVGAADKAFFHQEAGAGRSHVLRKFFDLNESDETWALDVLERRFADISR